jgi:hypothetical protein
VHHEVHALALALAVRAPRRRGQPGNGWLFVAVGLSAALMLAGVSLPTLRDLLGTRPVAPWAVLATIVLAALPGAGLTLCSAVRSDGWTGGRPDGHLDRADRGLRPLQRLLGGRADRGHHYRSVP